MANIWTMFFPSLWERYRRAIEAYEDYWQTDADAIKGDWETVLGKDFGYGPVDWDSIKARLQPKEG